MRRGTAGKPTNHNQGMFSSVTFAPNTIYDKGLMDTREVGYIY